MAIETTNKSPVDGAEPEQACPEELRQPSTSVQQLRYYSHTTVPSRLLSPIPQQSKTDRNRGSLKRGEFVHGFSCCKCGFVLDERHICIACGLTSVRIMKWVCAQPDRFQEMGEDDIEEYRTEKLVIKRQYQTRSSVKFALGDDPF